MLKKILALLCLLPVLALAACGPRANPETNGGAEEDTLTLTATTYPIYLFTREVTRGVEDVEVSLMINQSVSCLHDYTLTVRDMKVLDRADVVILNGAGLEESMAAALEASHARQIVCADGVELLASDQHHDHDHGDGDADYAEDGREGEPDPHIWMDPRRACQMLQTLARDLGQVDPANGDLYQANALDAIAKVTAAYQDLRPLLADLSCREMIPFHNGFSYFAQAFDLTIVRSIEEEAGSEASARDVTEILEELSIHHVPALFTETNGSDATARVIQRESGVPLYALDMLMSGPTESAGIDTYIAGITANVKTIQEAYS